jgi:pilus assembly protein CpaE
MALAHILVIDDDEEAAKLVALTLTRRNYLVTTKTDPISALNWLRIPSNKPQAIVLDVMMPGLDGFQFLHQLRADPTIAHLPVILLTARSQIDDKIAGFEAGADDYLVKPVTPTELELRIKAVLSRAKTKIAETSVQEAVVISVFSLRGGAGTTSIAVNLACALATMWETEVPLLDLDLRRGHCAWMLNLKARTSWVDLAKKDDKIPDPEIVESLLLKHKTGVKLLAAPPSPVEAELITPGVLDLAWPYMRGQYQFVIVDAGCDLSDLMLTVLERSNVVLLVVTPEMSGLKSAIDALHIFDQLDFPPEQVLPVINNVFPQDGLPAKNLASALKREVAAEIPHERGYFVRAINTGDILLHLAPRSNAVNAIARLAYQLSAASMNEEAVERPSELLLRARKLSNA